MKKLVVLSFVVAVLGFVSTPEAHAEYGKNYGKKDYSKGGIGHSGSGLSGRPGVSGISGASSDDILQRIISGDPNACDIEIVFEDDNSGVDQGGSVDAGQQVPPQQPGNPENIQVDAVPGIPDVAPRRAAAQEERKEPETQTPPTATDEEKKEDGDAGKAPAGSDTSQAKKEDEVETPKDEVVQKTPRQIALAVLSDPTKCAACHAAGKSMPPLTDANFEAAFNDRGDISDMFDEVTSKTGVVISDAEKAALESFLN